MKYNYKIIKIFEKKETRFTALIEYNNKKAVYKKLTTDNISLINKFNNEINILTVLNKPYVPKLYESGNDYIIMEYIESYNNEPKKFMKYIDENRINTIVNYLIDINTTKLKDIKPRKNHFLLNTYKTVLKLWINKYFKFFHIKVLFLMTYIYIKNKNLFALLVATKGDFTEVNILINDDEVKFIDFDTYNSSGAWLQDASYLLLHQDIEVKKLLWQKDFFKNYILKINKNYIGLNDDYIRFWLLYTSINQFYIRHHQYKYNLIQIKKSELEAKEEHIKYFLNNKFFNTFLSEVGFK